jgi:hypothetical protein
MWPFAIEGRGTEVTGELKIEVVGLDAEQLFLMFYGILLFATWKNILASVLREGISLLINQNRWNMGPLSDFR